MSARLALQGIDLDRGGRRVLDGVDIELRSGEVLGIIGPNGAGKSTALRVMAGLQSPDAGAVLFDGQPLAAHAVVERARSIGYLEQSASVHWPLSVRAVVELGRLPWRGGWFGSDSGAAAAIDAAMQVADVGEFSSRLLSELSGGEAMRVMIARVLAGEPAIILADEPVAALDVNHQLQVMELLSERAHAGAAVVIVLHDLMLAARFCDRLVLMDRGRVVCSGSPAEVLDTDVLENTYGVEMHRVEPEPGVSVPIPWRRR